MTSHYERRRALSHKPRGRTGSGNAKLTPIEREYMRNIYRAGIHTLQEVANMFEVSYTTAQKVCSCAK